MTRTISRIKSISGLAAILAGCDAGDTHVTNRLSVTNSFSPVPQLVVDSPQIIEGDTGTAVLNFALSLSIAIDSDASVAYTTVDGTAKAAEDYESRKGTVTFLRGETTKSLTIEIVGDTLDEDDEVFSVSFGNPVGLALNSSLTTGTIVDNDAPVSISVGDATVVERNSGASKILFPVTLDKPSGRPVQIRAGTIDGTALAPVDYQQKTVQLTFDPGQTIKSATVFVNGDTDDESNESFNVRLTNAVNAIIVDNIGIGTIWNDDPQLSGLEARPANSSCLAPDRPTNNVSIGATQVFNSLPDFARPVVMVQAPGDSSQWYVAEQEGAIYRFDNVPSPSGRSVFIDLTASVDSSRGEAGLLGFAFHPNYSVNRKAYVSYTVTGPGQSQNFLFTSRLSQFESTDGGLTLDPASEVVLISVDQPFHYHNGGHVTFGPDGFLYFALGDGGGDAATFGNRSQNTKNLFGSLLRIDVDAGSPYGIPPDNPFSGNALCNIGALDTDALESCPEIFAWGFRNPWRFSFDGATGALWLGDVGEHEFEEVNLVELGGNYGWNVQEGPACFEPPTGCDMSNLLQPVIAYDHTVGQSITGGYVYRGSDIPELFGRYFFVDFQSRAIMALTPDTGSGIGYEVLLASNLSLSSLAEDENGEIYGLRYLSGTIHKFIQAGGTANNTIPDSLIDTGCVDTADPKLPAEGLIPYDTIVDFWSDGAAKERYFAIPDAMTVDVDTDGDWQFPIGTVLVKNFRLAGKLIETRLFMRHTDGGWGGYTYEWNGSETEALRIVGGKTQNINGQDWIYPSESQCMSCHTDAPGFSLGLEFAQLNKNMHFPSSGVAANQLTTADVIEVLTDPLPDVTPNLPALADINDSTAPLADRVRSYLHTNCSGCHRPLGPTRSDMDLRYDTPWSATNTCDVVPESGDLGITDPRIIAPGDSTRSVMVNRIGRRDSNGMPPLGSSVVDTDGLDLLTTWIDSLTVCP
ncbi:MAG: PQQ-dependent sugar dehydrogenase [Gammaproteobacteria bacterium]|nr:PQQ-dependent sugar dehydrogenase [Gammaproteobacteria bacterium]MDH4316665.1 PQQ-dependent sugar dehydrogenase [Gammaproteobacteria bacterium]